MRGRKQVVARNGSESRAKLSNLMGAELEFGDLVPPLREALEGAGEWQGINSQGPLINEAVVGTGLELGDLVLPLNKLLSIQVQIQT